MNGSQLKLRLHIFFFFFLPFFTNLASRITSLQLRWPRMQASTSSQSSSHRLQLRSRKLAKELWKNWKRTAKVLHKYCKSTVKELPKNCKRTAKKKLWKNYKRNRCKHKHQPCKRFATFLDMSLLSWCCCCRRLASRNWATCTKNNHKDPVMAC